MIADNWYFQTDTDSRFLVPDKIQHFYGSRILSDKVGPIAAIVAGLLWEIAQERAGGMFSGRDLVANGFGVLSNRIRGPTGLYALYEKQQQTITLHFVFMF